MGQQSSHTKKIIGILLAACVVVALGCGVFFWNNTPAVQTVGPEVTASAPESAPENKPESAAAQEPEAPAEQTPETDVAPEQKRSIKLTAETVVQQPAATPTPSEPSKEQGGSGESSQPATPAPTTAPVATPAPTAPAGEQILQMQQDKLTLEVGMSEQLLTEESVPENVTWKNSNETVAVVSELGTVTALASGRTEITAVRGGVETTCVVTVTEPVVELNITQLDLQPEQTAALTLQGTEQTPTWYSSETAVATVDENGNVRAVGYGRSVIYAQIAEQSFACEVRCVPADTGSATELTRGEWIADLLAYMEIPVITEEALTVPGAGDGSNTVYYYCDTQNEPYGLEAETARMAGILPMDEDVQDVPAFDAAAPATREFAAMTLMRAAGFSVEGVEPLACADAGQLRYPEYAALSVQQGFLSLTEDGRFCPQEGIYREQEPVFWQILDTLKASTQVTETVEDIDYAEDVILLEESEGADYALEPVEGEDQTYRLTLFHCTEPVYAGNVLVLPVTEAYPGGYAIKITEVLERKDDSVTALGVVPQDLSEVIESLHFEGVGTPDVNGIEKLLPDDQLTISYDPNGTIEMGEETGYARAATTLADSRISVALPGKFTFDFGDGIELGDKGKLEGSVEMTIPDVTAIVDVDAGLFSGVKLKEVTFSITEKAEVKGEVSYTVTESEVTANGTNEKLSDSIELGRIPIRFGTTPFSLDLVCSVYWDVSGKVEIVYTIESTQGFQLKDGAYRNLKKVQQELELPVIEGSAEFGIKGAANLTFCSIWDLLGADMRVGPKATVSLNLKESKNLICLNGAVFLSGKLELNPDTIAGELLKEVWHYTLEYELWDQYNSPLSKYFHAESQIVPLGFHMVDYCTDEAGDIDGYVVNENGEPVKDVRLVLTEKGGNHAQLGKAYTNENGYYRVNNLPEGRYMMNVSKDGYLAFASEVEVNAGVCTQMDRITLVKRNQQGEGIVAGTATDAVTGGTLAQVNYIAYNGYNITDESQVAARGTVPGNYEISLPAGNYTLEFFADQYAKVRVNVAVSENNTVTANVVLSPESSEVGASNIRIVLTWGSQPRDLDSHLFGPTGTGSTFHTYYSNKTYGSIVELDRDDTSSYGPETTTVKQVSDTGVYSFYVHDYTNRNLNSSTKLSNSSAKVEVYFNNQLYAQLNIPANREGTVWHVFDYDATTDTFQVVNRMYYSDNPGSLEEQSQILQITESEAVSERDALAAIAQCEDKKLEAGETSVSISQPEVTGTPEPTAQPEVTGTPEPTAQPEAAGTPEPTTQLEAAGTPEPTAQPEVTGTPEPTTQPEAAGTPEPTAQSEVTGAPEPTAQPEVTGTAEPTVQQQAA